MGIDKESTNARSIPFEAEMRRRLWWSIVQFDTRVCEGADSLGCSTLVPTWDCRPPANLNDFDIRPDMKSLPPAHENPTEALYVVVRGTVGQFLRHSDFQLDFINPTLKYQAKHVRHGSLPEHVEDLAALENMIDTEYLRHYNAENPLHYMTFWSVRSQLAKARLMKHYWTYTRPSMQQTDAQRDAAMSYALRIIECEANLVNASLAKAFRWHLSHFQFLAYVHVVQDLRKRPAQHSAEQAWEMVSDDFKSRFGKLPVDGNPVFMLLAKSVIQAWLARETVLRQVDGSPRVPWIVEEMKRISVSAVSGAQEPLTPQTVGAMTMDLDDFLPVPIDFAGQDLSFDILLPSLRAMD